MHCYVLNIKATCLMVSEDFLKFFPIIRKLMTAPQDWPRWTPRAQLARFKTLLCTKYINYGSHRKDFYSNFPL